MIVVFVVNGLLVPSNNHNSWFSGRRVVHVGALSYLYPIYFTGGREINTKSKYNPTTQQLILALGNWSMSKR